DGAIDGKSGDVAAAARAFAPEGFDAALILAGGDAQKTALELVKKGGRAAYPHGVEPAPKKSRGLRVIGYDGETSARELERLREAVDAAKLEVPIGGAFSLDQAARAHEHLEGRVLGKIVLEIR